MATDEFVIAQVSDLHFGDGRFDPELASAAEDETNRLSPDLLVVAGDLTERGYREQYDEAVEWLGGIRCASRLVIPGMHQTHARQDTSVVLDPASHARPGRNRHAQHR